MIHIYCALMLSKHGASSAEYALILGLVCSAIVAGLTLLGTAVAAPFSAATVAMTP
jgi:Flp pilus assembly pilin Flp